MAVYQRFAPDYRPPDELSPAQRVTDPSGGADAAAVVRRLLGAPDPA